MQDDQQSQKIPHHLEDELQHLTPAERFADLVSTLATAILDYELHQAHRREPSTDQGSRLAISHDRGTVQHQLTTPEEVP